jgi:uncharacterized membrane protein YedE/YeeE
MQDLETENRDVGAQPAFRMGCGVFWNFHVFVAWFGADICLILMLLGCIAMGRGVESFVFDHKQEDLRDKEMEMAAEIDQFGGLVWCLFCFASILCMYAADAMWQWRRLHPDS